MAAPTAEPNWDPSEGRRSLLEYYLLKHLGRALKRETKAKELEKYSRTARNLAKQMKTSLNFWKGFQTYRCHTNADPKAPENIRMVNLTFLGKLPQLSGESYKNKMVHLD